MSKGSQGRRDPSRVKMMGTYVRAEFYTEIQAEAERRGLNVSEFIRELATDALLDRGIEVPDPLVRKFKKKAKKPRRK
ncbi:MAG: hypothetical protein CMO68_06035 [Verrucomicrobiales bacterium]|nr:hypothetical protein [Verrucomicrobiales bacterium]|tara:strand:+ start:567 stop:800 length:234 start_codon:yes stop_codon:yes gene_type:complete